MSNIADLFLDARVSEGRGERVAVRTNERNWTYAEVQALANRFAHVLAAAGVEPEQRVMIALPDGVAYVGALFGALKLGAVVVMVNPGLGHDDVAYLVRLSRAKAIVTHHEVAGAFRAAAAASLTRCRVIETGGEDFGQTLA